MKNEALLKKIVGDKYYKLVYQFLKFGVVGVINTGVDTGIYLLLFHMVFNGALGFKNYLSYAVGYCCGVTCSYLLNKLWTFKDKSTSIQQIAKFVLVNLVAMGVGLVEIKLLEQIGIVGFLAKIISVPLTLVVNFTGNKLFVFKN